MYESQFFLKRRPFAATPDPRCFLASGDIQAALDELVVCVQQGQGVAVVSAPAGTGKTLLCERLRSELDGQFEIVFLRHASFLTRRALLQTILADLNHAYRRQDEQELRLELVPAIRALNPKREALVLICDEAHMLTEDLLEELRILADLAEQGRPLVRLVLVGQPGLEETLAHPGLEALNQRIRAHVCLDSFNRVASLDYIDYRITWAGGRSDEIFTAEALELICRASQGVPRCINQLCDHALLLAYVSEQRPVDADTIREALLDLRQLPLHWNESFLTDASTEPSALDEIEPKKGLELDTITRSAEFPTAMQSREFGADLPLANASVEEIGGDEDEDDSLATDMESSEPDFVDEIASAERQTIVRQSVIVATPHPFSVQRSAVKFTRPVNFPTSIGMPGAIVEEIIWDRYAAIDGGFPVPAVMVSTGEQIADVRQSAVMENVSDTPQPQQVQGEPPTQANSDRSLPPLNATADDGFGDVCARLDHMLPEIVENSSWDSASLEFGSDQPHSTAVESATERDEWDSLEEELGMTICELAGEVRAELQVANDANVAVDQLEQILGTGHGDVSSFEFGPASETDNVSAAPAKETSARPYRNLFSQLRRKQQGLL